MSTPTRPALRYHGGKWRLAPWIISHFPPHRVYVEPFGGAASVLIRKPRALGEVYNDQWGAVVDLFRVLRDREQAEDLCRRLQLTPFSRAEFEAATDLLNSDEGGPIDRAWAMVVRSFQGFGSEAVDATSSTGFRSNSMRSNTTPALEWKNYPKALASVADRFRGVIIENRDATDVMRGFDAIDTLHYLDPPYVHSTRKMRHGYVHEMTDADHERLAASVHDLRGMVVVSGYPSELYDRLYSGWHRVETKALADGALERIEVIWLNHAARAAQRQRDLFGEVAA